MKVATEDLKMAIFMEDPQGTTFMEGPLQGQWADEG
jgi:hypothetical protein